MMTKKHFNLIAAAIRREMDVHCDNDTLSEAARLSRQAGRLALGNIAEDLAGEFVRENPNFDQRRFLAACGLEV